MVCNPESTLTTTSLVVRVIVPCVPLDSTDDDIIPGTFENKCSLDNEPLILAFVKLLISVAFGPNEPLMPSFVRLRISVAFTPKEPLILAFVKLLISLAFGPNEPLILAFVKLLISVAFGPKEPLISLAICTDELIKPKLLDIILPVTNNEPVNWCVSS